MRQVANEPCCGLRLMVVLSLVVMSAALFLLVDIHLGWEFWFGGSRQSDFSEAYRPLVLILLGSVVVAALASHRLDRARGRTKPLFRSVAENLSALCSKLVSSAPLWLKIAAPVATLLFLVSQSPHENLAIEYQTLDAPLSILHSQQLILESRGEAIKGYSRWRIGDRVRYFDEPGYRVLRIVPTGRMDFEELTAHAGVPVESLNLIDMLNSLPDGSLAALIGHGQPSACLIPQLESFLLSLGVSANRESLGSKGHILILQRSGQVIEPVVELIADHAFVALNPNLLMRAYLLLRKLLPEICVLAFVLTMLVLIAGFARLNHKWPWPAAFGYGALALPLLGALLLIDRACDNCIVLVVVVMAALGAYISYIDAFSAGRRCALFTAAVAVLLCCFTQPQFLSSNSFLIEAAWALLSVYLAFRLYRLLFGRCPAIEHAIRAFCITRAPLIVICYLSTFYFSDEAPRIWDMANRWDAGYFLTIADHGYHLSATAHSPASFLPFYPFLCMTFRPSFSDTVICGAVVSNIAFVVALALLYHLTSVRWGHNTARKSIVLMALGPWSLFFSAVYPESVFLLLCIAFILLAQDKRWFWAGLCGMCAALTRPVGLILMFVGVWEYIRQARFSLKRLRLNVAWLLLVPVGCGLFSFTLYAQTGDMVANVTATEAWGTRLVNPLNFLRYMVSITDLNLSKFSGQEREYHLMTAISVLVYVLVLLAIVPIALRLGTTFALFAALSMLLPLAMRGIPSAGRFSQVLFPVSILLALYCRRENAFIGVAVAFATVLTFFAILFANTFWLV